LMFNLASYERTLMADFSAKGGRIEIAEFHTPAEFARLKEKTLVNATGYAARALFGDQSIVPVRGAAGAHDSGCGRELRSLLQGRRVRATPRRPCLSGGRRQRLLRLQRRQRDA